VSSGFQAVARTPTIEAGRRGYSGKPRKRVAMGTEMQKSPVIAKWHALVARKDATALHDLLADDVSFLSPVVYKPQIGKPIVEKYLGAALRVLNNETFAYRNEWTADTSAVLEFEAVIDGISINGVDIITWNSDQKITEFKVMLRPLKAVNLVHQLMASMLQKMDRVA
jgi:hypothetical protein